MQPADLTALGIAIIPLAPRSKSPLVRWRDYQSRLPTDTELQRWFYPNNSRNVAAICGWQGLTVLDFDDAASYGAWVAWAAVSGGVARRAAADGVGAAPAAGAAAPGAMNSRRSPASAARASSPR